jgi:hypothetical protein
MYPAPEQPMMPDDRHAGKDRDASLKALQLMSMGGGADYADFGMCSATCRTDHPRKRTSDPAVNGSTP